MRGIWPEWLPPICLTATWVLVESVPQVIRNLTFEFTFDNDLTRYSYFFTDFGVVRRDWIRANAGVVAPLGTQGIVRDVSDKVCAIDISALLHLRSIALKDISHCVPRILPAPWLRTRPVFAHLVVIAPLLTRVTITIPYIGITRRNKNPTNLYRRYVIARRSIVRRYNLVPLVSHRHIKTVELVGNANKYETGMTRVDPLRAVLAIGQSIVVEFRRRGRQDVNVEVFQTGQDNMQRKVPVRAGILPQGVTVNGDWA